MHSIVKHISIVLVASAFICNALEGKKYKPRSARLASKGQLSIAADPADKNIQQEIVVDEPVQEIAATAQPTTDQEASPQGTAKDQPAKIIEQPSELAQAKTITGLAVAQEEPVKEKPKEEPADIIFNFENADLKNMISYVENLFKITFIPDDAVNPIIGPDRKSLEGNKISFKTQRPLTKKQAWALFNTFLDMAGLSVYQEGGVSNVYRITTIKSVQKSPIPAFIGVDSETLPDNDTKVRYVYFVENTSVDTLRGIIESLKSTAASVTLLNELKAILITDSAYNIKVLMRVVKELDKVTMPQAMSVLKLRKVDAAHVESLYKSLTGAAQEPGVAGRVMGPLPRKASGAYYFPEDIRMISEPRTNSLILLGTHEAISKIEDFIVKYIDIELDMPYSPLHVFPLKYASADTVAAIMQSVTTKFDEKAVEAKKVGGVRGDDKYLKPMTFTAEPTSNRVIVRGDYNDFLKVKEIMTQLDEPQPQVAIEILILSVLINDVRELGAQLRSSPAAACNPSDGIAGLIGNNVQFQTSGLRAGGLPQGVVTNPNPATGNQRLLGDLINLVVGKGIGNTIVSLGTDCFGVWGIFDALQSAVNTQVISNPFLIATNKAPAKIAIGETRRVTTGTTITAPGANTVSKGDDSANLTVNITPQINSDGMIILNLVIDIQNFISPPTDATPAKLERHIDTATIVANKEVLALGGLIRNVITETQTQVPVLGNIPIIGWLFKNKHKDEAKECLLILISSRIIDPVAKKDVDAYTQDHLDDYREDLNTMRTIVNDRDAIDRAFFKDKPGSTGRVLDNYLFKDSPEIKKVFEDDEKRWEAKVHNKPYIKTTKLAKAPKRIEPTKTVPDTTGEHPESATLVPDMPVSAVPPATPESIAPVSEIPTQAEDATIEINKDLQEGPKEIPQQAQLPPKMQARPRNRMSLAQFADSHTDESEEA